MKPKLTAKWKPIKRAYTPCNSRQFNWRGINPIVVCVAVFGRLQQQLTKLNSTTAGAGRDFERCNFSSTDVKQAVLHVKPQ